MRERDPRRTLAFLLLVLALAAVAVVVTWSRADPAPRVARPAGVPASAAPTLRVLFVGNSYTYVNDLPGALGDLVAASGTGGIALDSVTAGGASLGQHLANPEVLRRIRAGGWTHVVIQGHSTEPLLDPAPFETAAAGLVAEVRRVGAVPVFYETWARRAGDALYAEPRTGGKPELMQAGLEAAYARVALASGGLVAPVGEAFARALKEAPAIPLHQSDGSHPSVAGTHLAALVFFATLTGQSPERVTQHPPGLSDADAQVLAHVAAEVVRARRRP